MRRILLLSLCVMLVAIPAFSQITTPVKDNIVFGGLQYTSKVAIGEKNLVLGAGYGFRVTGNIWELNTGQIGTAGYVAAEPVLAYVFTLSGKPGGTHLRAMLHAGVSGDWLKFDSTAKWLAYLPGTFGGSLYLEFANGTGFVLTAREKFALNDGTQYVDGWLLNLNVTKRW